MAWVRVVICPVCKSEDCFTASYDDEDAVLECQDCGERFMLDETDKVYEEDETSETLEDRDSVFGAYHEYME